MKIKSIKPSLLSFTAVAFYLIMVFRLRETGTFIGLILLMIYIELVWREK